MDHERELGEIHAQVRYLSQEIQEIKSDLKILLSFRWKVMGIATLTAFVATLAIEVAKLR